MSNSICTAQWLSFKMTEIFEMKNTRSITSASVAPDSGQIPYVTAQEGNNGVQMYVDGPQEWLENRGCILIGGKTLSFSYQAHDFFSNDSHNIALYSHDTESKHVHCQLFLIAVLRASLSSSYSWGDSISMTRIKRESIMLPAASTGTPDWQFMRKCMATVMSEQERELAILQKAISAPTHRVSSDDWREFRIDELFNVVKGSRLTKSAMIPGDIRHIGASQFNNGITAMIANDEAIHPGNVLTVCYDGPVGTTFYQAERFWATDAVNVLYPRFELNELIALFLIPVLQEAGSAFHYGEKWGATAMRTTVVSLPTTEHGDPDWVFMEETMCKVLADRRAALTNAITLQDTH